MRTKNGNRLSKTSSGCPEHAIVHIVQSAILSWNILANLTHMHTRMSNRALFAAVGSMQRCLEPGKTSSQRVCSQN